MPVYEVTPKKFLQGESMIAFASSSLGRSLKHGRKIERTETLLVGNYNFVRVTEITPRRTDNGEIAVCLPQDRFDNERSLALNRYGKGPFCKFSIPSKINQPGVYLITVSGAIRYVGECNNLSSRFNMGYGNISPRNCFKGGQETNCRVNSLIYEEARRSERVELWFYPTEEYKRVEQELRSQLRADWNRA